MPVSETPLISIQCVSKSHGTRPLFSEISLVIGQGEKVALIGPNGSGKSTLLRILAQVEDPDHGEISFRKDARLAYAPQKDVLPDEGSVADALLAVLDHDQHQVEARVSQYLGKAGFADKDQPVNQLSGGWRKRLALLRAIIQEPDCLLLDEPTNQLDIPGIRWLEELLAELNCAVLFVSHDRYFIERVAARVVELDRRYPKGYLAVNGAYSDFLPIRLNFLEQLESHRDILANKVRREVAWLRQGAKARTTKAKGRIREANELIGELGKIELQENRTALEFSASGRRSKELIKVEMISQTLAGRTLFERVNLLLSPGVRLGVVGKNGSGKTTLLRTLLKELPPDHGKVWHATQLRIAHFDQARTKLDGEQTLQRALCSEGDAVVFNGRSLHVSSWARRFLFRTDQLQLPVKNLSGGEQARLLIARLMLTPADVLVLDEPTNDLDIATLEVLEEALCEFAGAVVLVTHDRYILDRVSTSVLGLGDKGRGGLFADYSQWEARETQADEVAAAKPKPEPSPSERPVRSEAKSLKLSYSERLELRDIEQKIIEAEAKLEAHQNVLNSSEVNTDSKRLTAHCAELSEHHRIVDELYARWQVLEAKKAADSSE